MVNAFAPDPITPDPIVEEVRKIREGHAARFQYDVHAIAEDLKKRQEERGVSVVSFPPKLVVNDQDVHDVPRALDKAS